MNVDIKLKLCKLESGYYKTADNRFWIRDSYCPNAAGSSKDKRWVIEDKSGKKPFMLSNFKSAIQRVDTLTEAKEIVGLVYQREAEEEQLLKEGYSKCENIQLPGVCWRSPHTGELITRSKALLELSMRQ